MPLSVGINGWRRSSVRIPNKTVLTAAAFYSVGTAEKATALSQKAPQDNKMPVFKILEEYRGGEH